MPANLAQLEHIRRYDETLIKYKLNNNNNSLREKRANRDPSGNVKHRDTANKEPGHRCDPVTNATHRRVGATKHSGPNNIHIQLPQDITYQNLALPIQPNLQIQQLPDHGEHQHQYATKITIPCISTNNKAKILIINFRNPEGWQRYKIISDIYILCPYMIKY